MPATRGVGESRDEVGPPDAAEDAAELDFWPFYNQIGNVPVNVPCFFALALATWCGRSLAKVCESRSQRRKAIVVILFNYS